MSKTALKRHRILLADEIQEVLADLDRRCKVKKSENAQLNRAIFRLSCCCGLRRKEIAGLQIGDIWYHGRRPHIKIRSANTKAYRIPGRKAVLRRARRVPLWWDKGTFRAIYGYVMKRKRQGALNDSLLCVQTGVNFGKRLGDDQVSRRWKTAIRILGPERLKHLSVHDGRHSFLSHAIHNGRTLPEVMEAAGHGSIEVTSIYLHAIDTEGLADLFPKPDYLNEYEEMEEWVV